MIICILLTVLLFAFVWLYFHRVTKRMRLEIRTLRGSVGAQRETMEKFANNVADVRQLREETAEIPGLKKRVLDLENGLVPDFEQAKAAVSAVNDFNKGLTSIMGYDPMEAVKKARKTDGGDPE